jgi:hypothetical protein
MSHANPSETLAGELGPVLLDRKVSQPDAVTTLGVGVVCLIVGAVLIAVGGAGFDGSLSFTLALGTLLGLLGSVIFIVTFRTYWARRGTRQFVHERGLREESARGVICIGYDEADELEYRVTDHYNHGIYAGTYDHFALRTAGAPGKEIAYRQFRRRRDEPTPFPPIVDAVSARLGARFAEAIGRGESVRWTTKMTIHPDGLTLSPRPPGERPGLAMFRKEQPSRVGWDDIDKIEVDEGFCRLRLKGSSEPRLTVEAGVPNFYPGYRVVAETLRARDASRPVVPVRGLAHGEKITVEYPYSIEVRFGMERAAFLVSPKAQKNAREMRFGFALFLPACGVGLAVMAYFEGTIAGAALQMRLLVCFLFGVAANAAIEAWERISTRRKVYREARLAQDRYQSGQGPDPAYVYQVTLGPPGFSCRMPQGEFQRPWSTVSRVLWDRGSIIICNAGNALQPETVVVFLPAVAFDDSDRARDAFERITEWHRAGRNLTAAS